MKTFSERKNIFFGLIFSGIMLMVSLLGSFFITPIVLNTIGDKNYGFLSFCNSITTWLTLVSGALGASYVYFATKESKADGTEGKTNNLFFRMLSITSVIVVVLAIAIVFLLKICGFQFSKYSKEENDLIFVLLAVSGINVGANIFFSTFQLYNNYKKSFIIVRGIAIFTSLLTYCGNLLIATFYKSVILIAIFSIGITILQGILNLFFAFKAGKMVFSKSSKEELLNDFRSIIKYSSIVLIGLVIENLDSNLDQTLLGAMVSAESVTMYHLSITFQSSLAILAWAFIETLRPKIHELYRLEKDDEANELFLKICKFQSIVVLFIVGGFISCGYHLVTVWLGAKRIDVYYYSVALFVARIVPLTISASGEAYRAKNMHIIVTIFSIITIVVNLIISIALLLILNARLAVWACILGTIIPMFLFSYIIVPIYDYHKLHLPIGRYYINLLKNLVMTLIAIIPSIILSNFLNKTNMSFYVMFFLEGVLFVLIYVVETLVFERKIVKNIISVYLKKETQQ